MSHKSGGSEGNKRNKNEYSPRAVENCNGKITMENSTKTQVCQTLISNNSCEVKGKPWEFLMADSPGQVKNILPVEDKTEEEDHLQKRRCSQEPC